MIEQKYYIDPNTIDYKKPNSIFGFRFGSPLITAKGVAPFHEEKFVMVDCTYSQSETIRKLVSLRNRTNLGQGFVGEDFTLGPNIESDRSRESIVWGNSDQLRIWIRDPWRNNE